MCFGKRMLNTKVTKLIHKIVFNLFHGLSVVFKSALQSTVFYLGSINAQIILVLISF